MMQERGLLLILTILRMSTQRRVNVWTRAGCSAKLIKMFLRRGGEERTASYDDEVQLQLRLSIVVAHSSVCEAREKQTVQDEVRRKSDVTTRVGNEDAVCRSARRPLATASPRRIVPCLEDGLETRRRPGLLRAARYTRSKIKSICHKDACQMWS